MLTKKFKNKADLHKYLEDCLVSNYNNFHQSLYLEYLKLAPMFMGAEAHKFLKLAIYGLDLKTYA
jgi:hypothetical protein